MWKLKHIVRDTFAYMHICSYIFIDVQKHLTQQIQTRMHQDTSRICSFPNTNPFRIFNFLHQNLYRHFHFHVHLQTPKQFFFKHWKHTHFQTQTHTCTATKAAALFTGVFTSNLPYTCTLTQTCQFTKTYSWQLRSTQKKCTCNDMYSCSCMFLFKHMCTNKTQF